MGYQQNYTPPLSTAENFQKSSDLEFLGSKKITFSLKKMKMKIINNNKSRPKGGDFFRFVEEENQETGDGLTKTPFRPMGLGKVRQYDHLRIHRVGLVRLGNAITCTK